VGDGDSADVYVYDVLGDDVRRLTDEPDSGALALSLEEDPGLGSGLAVMRPGEAPSLVPDPLRPGYWGPVRWSPGLGRFFAESEVGVLAFTPARPLARPARPAILTGPGTHDRVLAF